MTPTVTPEAQTVLDKVKALREYTQRTGWKTTKSQNDLIQAIPDPNDLATVLLALQE